MIKQKQLFRHKPEEGIIGDCERTAIACLLDKRPEEVPHFGEAFFDDGEAFNKMEDAYLLTQGYTRIQVIYQDTLENVLEALRFMAKDVYYLLSGRSKTGCNHTVIGCGGEIVWDPSLDDSGIVGPCNDGYYWVAYIVSIKFMRKTENA